MIKSLIILDSERRNFPTTNNILRLTYTYLEDIYLKTVYSWFIIPKLRLLKKDSKIIALDKETELILKKNNIPFSVIKDYICQTESGKFEKNVINYVRMLPKILPEIDVKYRGVSLWTADEPDIYESLFKPIIMNIEIINKIITIENAKTLIILNSSTKLGSIQKLFYKKVVILDKTDLLSRIRTLIFEKFISLAVKTINSNFFKKIKSKECDYQKINKILFFEGSRFFGKSKTFLKNFKGDLTVLHNELMFKETDGFMFENFENFINKESEKRIFSFKIELENALRKIKMSPKFKEKLKYRDISIYSSSKEALEYLFRNGYLKSAFYSECLTNIFQQNISKLIIIGGECIKKNKIIAMLSRRYGLPLFLILHGTVGDRDIYDNLSSTNIAVYGEYYKDILIKKNNPSKKIIVTGNPAWENINSVTISKDILYNKSRLPNKKIILFATTHIPQDTRDRLTYAVFNALLKLSDYHLVIKLHPEEKKEFYIRLLKKFKLQATITEDLHLLHPLIKYSELVIISNSTVGVETILLDKPLIDVELTIMPYWNDYVSENVALGVKKEEELLPAINSILHDKKVVLKLKRNRKRYIYTHAYKQDGKASDRVTKLIKKCLKSDYI